VGGGERKVGGFWSGVKEKRREESVMFGRGWSGVVEEKRRKESFLREEKFSGFPKRCTLHLHVFFKHY